MQAQELTQGLTIRGGNAADAPSIARVLHESFAEYEHLYTPEGVAATTPPSQLIAQRLSEGPTWVALLDGEIVGTLSAVRKGEGLYVRSMAILPEARGRQIGDSLMRQVEGFAHDTGAKSMYLS